MEFFANPDQRLLAFILAALALGLLVAGAIDLWDARAPQRHANRRLREHRRAVDRRRKHRHATYARRA